MTANDSDRGNRDGDSAAPAAAASGIALEISLREMLRHAWRGKFIIIVCVAGTVALALLSVGMREPTYVATVLIRPVPASHLLSANRRSQEQLSRTSQTILQRLNPSPAATSSSAARESRNRFERAMAKLHTFALARRLSDLGVMGEASEMGVPEQEGAPGGGAPAARATATASSVIAFLTRRPQQMAPVERLAELLNRIAVKTTDIPGMHEISFRHNNAKFAAEFVRSALREADTMIREQKRAELARQIDYLRRRQQDIEAVDYRDTLTELIALAELEYVLLDIDTPYSYEITRSGLDPAALDPPRLELIVMLSLVGGLTLGFLALALRQSLS